MKTFTQLLLSCLCCYICTMGQDTAILLKDVVVTGQYQAQSVKQSVYRVRTISSERIQLRGATDVLGILHNGGPRGYPEIAYKLLK